MVNDAAEPGSSGAIGGPAAAGGHIPSGPVRAASRPALFGWVMYDWAAQPFFTLITTFLFAPYFANGFLSDSVQGQAYWGYATALAGLVLAFMSPVLGAIADVTGRLKPWIAVFSVIMVFASAALWYAEPGAEDKLLFVLGAFVIGTIAAEMATVFTNSMMPSLVPPGQIGRLSGIGWAVGYCGGLVSLVVMAGLIVVNPETGRTLLGLEPLLALDTAAREGDRMSGPFTAVWFAIFALPLFLFTPDIRAERSAHTMREALSEGMADLMQTIRQLPSERDVLTFLIARMLYNDGLLAIFTFGGLYGATVFQWGAFELGLFGIVLTLAGTAGALVGGFLDDRFGARAVILVTLVGLLASIIGIIGIDRDTVLFVFSATPPMPDDGVFGSGGEKAYLVCAILIGAVSGPLQSASRSLMARLAPPEKQTQYFGLFAFSGKVTSFLAPLSVGIVTSASGSQTAGVAVIAVFLIGGFILMTRVRERPSRG